jgi:hypothetical protein
LKVAQDDKQTRQAQLEPLQQDTERMIEELQEEKGTIEKMHVECRQVLSRAHYNIECGEVGKSRAHKLKRK